MMPFEAGNLLLIKNIEQVLGKEILISPDMCRAMALWEQMYMNRAPWKSDEVKSMNLASAISTELACQATLDFTSMISGSQRAEALNQLVYQDVIRDIRHITELACACGGIVFKPYLEKNQLAVEYVRASHFFPLEIDCRGEIVSAVFMEQIKRKDRYYTRLEEHTFDNGTICIRNHAFSGGIFGLSRSIPLSEISEWANLEEEVSISGAKRPLFSYFKIPLANTVDLGSPLGVSVFSRAVELLEETDKQFSRLIWEYEGGELAVDASVDALLMENGDMKMPALGKRLFRALDLDAGGSDLYSVFAPALRDGSYLAGLNEMLIQIEDLCGLARGGISNLNNAARTATELRLLRQRSYATVTDIQKALQRALEGLIDSLDIIATVFSLLPPGERRVTFEFDDSSVVDRSVQFEEMERLVNQGIISKWEFRSWYLGESEEQAKEKLTEVLSFGTDVKQA